MQLLDVADNLAGTYSGGMVRRLELAQALVNRPSLLILDEPTVGLDPIARDGVWSQVARMQDEFGMTVLLTTHYMEEADALCDRVALMHHGVLQTVGAPDDLKPRRSRTASLEDVFRHYAGSDLDRGRRAARACAKSAPAEGRPAVSVDTRLSCRVHPDPRARAACSASADCLRGWALSRSSNCRSCATTAPSCSPGWCSPRCGC